MMPSLLDWWHIAAEIIEHREYKFRETRELERKSTFFSTSLRLKYPFQSVGIALEDHTPRGTSSITAPRPGGRFKRQKADGGMAARKRRRKETGRRRGGRSFASA